MWVSVGVVGVKAGFGVVGGRYDTDAMLIDAERRKMEEVWLRRGFNGGGMGPGAAV